MTDMQDQIPTAMSNGKTKQPVRRYILINICLFLIYYIGLMIASRPFAILLPGWSEIGLQLCVCLPFGLIGYKLMKKIRPVESRPIAKTNFRRFQLLYLLLIQIPVKYGSLFDAAAAAHVAPSPTANLVHSLLLAPFIEEFVYRGVFYNLARKKLDPKHAAIVNGLIFAFVHDFRPLNLLNAFLIGVLHCELYEMTGSLKYGIILHYTFNLLKILLLFIAGLIPAFIALPLMTMGFILHIILVIRKDKLEAMLFA